MKKLNVLNDVAIATKLRQLINDNATINRKFENIDVDVFKIFVNASLKNDVYKMQHNVLRKIAHNARFKFKIDDIVDFKFHASNKKFDAKKTYRAKIVDAFKYACYNEYLCEIENMYFKKRAKTLHVLNDVTINVVDEIKNFEFDNIDIIEIFKQLLLTMYVVDNKKSTTKK